MLNKIEIFLGSEIKNIHKIILGLILGVIIHLIYSSYGFNPTDEGFILAYSKRILSGEVPHRDFISIRPIFSAYLHTLAYIFYDYGVFYVSRLIVSIELSFISILSLNFICNMLSKRLSLLKYTIYLLLIHFLSIHNFPLMAWHTIDALIFVLLGLNIYKSKIQHSELLGLLIISVSSVCKQNFIIVAPLAHLILSENKSIKNLSKIAISLLPILLYILIISQFVSIEEIKIQLLTQSNFVKYALIKYLNPLTMCGVACFLLAYWKRNLFSLVILGIISTVMMIYILNLYLIYSAYIVFGFIFSLTLFENNKTNKMLNYIFLLIAWTSSISVGYNSPIFLIGQLIALLLFNVELNNNKFKTSQLVFVTSLIVIVCSLSRYLYVYRDESSYLLKSNLFQYEKTLNKINTNLSTASKIKEANALYLLYSDQKKQVLIMPDFPYFWANKDHKNPICIDWPQETELNSNNLVDRVIQQIKSKQDNLIVLVQKYESDRLKNREVILGNNYRVVNYIKGNFIIVDSTNYFYVYSKIKDAKH